MKLFGSKQRLRSIACANQASDTGHKSSGEKLMQLELLAHHPDGKAHPTPILFIHGAWHAAWCWENFLPYFTEHGYHAYALSLRGHGNSEGHQKIRWWSAARDYVADVAQIVQKLDSSPIIIGHSMGGYVIQKYLENNNLPAGVLLAPTPVSGLIGYGIRCFLQNPWPFIKTHLLLDLWHMVATPQLTHASFFSADMPQEEVERHFARLQSESLLMELEATFLALPRPKKIKTPLLVLAAENDRVFSVAEEKATARAYNTQAEIFPNMAHDMMLEANWQKVAARIVDWLQERDL